MRILQAMAGAKVGGAEAFFVPLARAFAKAGRDQHFLIRHHPDRAAALRGVGAAVTELAFGGLLDLGTRRRFQREIESFRPDIVLTWMNRATRFCPTPARTRIPFVHVARLGGYYNLKHYRRCDHLIANTRGIADYLVERGWPRERVHHLPNFVENTATPPVPRATLDTPEGAAIVLALGRLHRNKAFEVLLEALPALPEVWLWLAGTGPEESALRSLARSLGIESRVRFLGWREDTPALFAAADLLVCPSRHEPLGNVIAEAWAQNTPVVAAAAAGPRELIEDGGNGLLVPTEDSAALGGAIRRALSIPDLREHLVAEGRRAFEAEFTEARAVERYGDLFRQITAARKAVA